MDRGQNMATVTFQSEMLKSCRNLSKVGVDSDKNEVGKPERFLLEGW